MVLLATAQVKGVVFSDDFTGAASALWGNEVGLFAQ